ncbi:hypothetical protein IEQ34_008181 [Dendrobium chrysotoxum]|uniref:Uncharacterized protein n=1 Tax=Dendrobium chrysotoxum TaxID=161865 RepID=A0AAV7H6A2_DENCH|nr:hypothetical protein IEQ34_008181 [Dendrobium chrysotoxum]
MFGHNLRIVGSDQLQFPFQLGKYVLIFNGNEADVAKYYALNLPNKLRASDLDPFGLGLD